MLTPSETRAREARERPIIFSAPMVKAILAGRKTQTRRILGWQPDPAPDYHSGPHQNADGVWGQTIWEPGSVEQFCPLRLPAAVGDCLWVRETWCHTGTGVWSVGDTYTALDGKVIFRADDDGRDPGIKWFSPLYLPRNRSRLTLEVTEVRVERLQDISEADAIAEGATSRPRCSGYGCLSDGWSMDWSRVGQPGSGCFKGRALNESDIALGSAVSAFANFINGLHDPRWNYKGDGIFGANPWVAAITFRPLPASLESQKEGAAV